MKIKEIKIENLFSFENFQINFCKDNKPNSLSVIVGPTNSGKTNLWRVLDFLVSKINRGTKYRVPRYFLHDFSSPRYRVEVSIILEEELKLLSYFFKLYARKMFNAPDPKAYFEVEEEKIQGEKWSQLKHKWKQQFVFSFPNLSENLKELTIGAKTRDPESLPTFYIKTQLGGENGKIKIKDNIITKNANRGGNFFRLFFLHLSKLVDNDDELLSKIQPFLRGRRNTIELPTIDIEELLENIVEIQPVDTFHFNLELNSEERNKFQTLLRRVSLSYKRGYDLSLHKLLLDIFAKRLIMFQEFRRKPADEYSVNDLTNMEEYRRYTGDGKQLARTLLSLKLCPPKKSATNFTDLKQHFKEILKEANCEDIEISADFDEESFSSHSTRTETIAGQKDILTKFSERVLKHMQDLREETPKPVKASLKIFVECNEKWLPLERVGGGVFEVLNLLTTIIGNTNHIILLDEPEHHIHPKYQKKVLEEELHDSDNQVILITHSPSLIPQEELENVIRFYMKNGKSKKAEVKNILQHRDWFQRQIKRWSKVKNLLFSTKALIAEGHHEYLVLSRTLPIDRYDVTLLDGEGENNLEKYRDILKTLHIDFRIACDAHAEQTLNSKTVISYPYHDLSDLMNEVLDKVENNKYKNLRKYVNHKDVQSLRTHLNQHGRAIKEIDPLKNWLEKVKTWIKGEEVGRKEGN